jgi:hypothetical protein
MHGSIDEKRRRPASVQDRADDVRTITGANPDATCHTTRPGEGRDGDTARRRWCL